MSEYQSNPYSAPGSAATDMVQTERPAVVLWQMVYCGLMVLLYVAVAALGVFFYTQAANLGSSSDEVMEMRILGGVYSALGVVLGLVFAGGLFLRRGMVGWVFHIVLICLGLTSCVTWPATIPLLIFWIKHKDAIVTRAWETA